MKAGVDAVHAEGPAALLVNPDQQALLFLAAVEIVARVADDRHAEIQRLEFGHGVGQKIHVLHRRDRMAHAEHRADLVDPVTGRVDHFLAGDIAVLAVHDELAAGLARDALDRVEAIHLGAGLARLARQREGNPGRVDIAVERVPPGAEQSVGVDQRVPPAGLGGVDELHLHAHAAGHADIVPVDIDLLGLVREAHAAGDVVRNRIVGIGRQLAVQVDAVPLQRHHGLVAAELGDLGRGVPGRAGSEFIAFEQNHVGPALTGQVIQCRATGDPATDDDDPGVRFYRTGHVLASVEVGP